MTWGSTQVIVLLIIVVAAWALFGLPLLGLLAQRQRRKRWLKQFDNKFWE